MIGLKNQWFDDQRSSVYVDNNFVGLKFKHPRKDLVALIGLKNQWFDDHRSSVYIDNNFVGLKFKHPSNDWLEKSIISWP